MYSFSESIYGAGQGCSNSMRLSGWNNDTLALSPIISISLTRKLAIAHHWWITISSCCVSSRLTPGSGIQNTSFSWSADKIRSSFSSSRLDARLAFTPSTHIWRNSILRPALRGILATQRFREALVKPLTRPAFSQPLTSTPPLTRGNAPLAPFMVVMLVSLPESSGLKRNGSLIKYVPSAIRMLIPSFTDSSFKRRNSRALRWAIIIVL